MKSGEICRRSALQAELLILNSVVYILRPWGVVGFGLLLFFIAGLQEPGMKVPDRGSRRPGGHRAAFYTLRFTRAALSGLIMCEDFVAGIINIHPTNRRCQ